MIQTVPLKCSFTTFLVESKPAASRNGSNICCSASRKSVYLPNLESFGRNKIDRHLKGPPLIQKSKNEIADYCLTLEGDELDSCWQAYFELRDLEEEAPKEDIERMIMRAGDVQTLIGRIHNVAPIYKAKKESRASAKPKEPENTVHRMCPIPDGLPKTPEELEEEEEARMPDSPFTRLLRAKGRSPAWYTLPPDHETD